MDYNKGHPTGQPVADDVVVGQAAVYADPAFSDSAPQLSAAEVEHFKREGFIVKRGLLDEPRAFSTAIDHVWQNVPRDLLRRDDPASWYAGADSHWTDADAERVGRLMGGNWKMRSRNDIGTEPFLVDSIANHPNMISVAEAFFGAPVMRCRRVRGIYCVLPDAPDATGRYGPHADYSAAHLSAMVVIDDIPPQAGGFTIWPGSHHQLHPHWDTLHGGLISADRSDGFRLARDAVLREITPLEMTGQPGDVIFWHPRLLHSAGINQTARTSKPLVRIIVPCDYQRADRTYYDDMEYGPGPKYQWWVDTRNAREDVAPSAENMWSDWGI